LVLPWGPDMDGPANAPRHRVNLRGIFTVKTGSTSAAGAITKGIQRKRPGDLDHSLHPPLELRLTRIRLFIHNMRPFGILTLFVQPKQGREAMNKSQLIEALAKAENLALKKAEEVVNTVFGDMENALIRGERVEIRGFGSFKIKNYKGYQGRNPKTGEVIHVADKKLPFFKVGKELKERVDIL